MLIRHVCTLCNLFGRFYWAPGVRAWAEVETCVICFEDFIGLFHCDVEDQDHMDFRFGVSRKQTSSTEQLAEPPQHRTPRNDADI